MHFKTETITRPDTMQNNCERCGKELDELYERDSSDYELVVLKCPQCKAVYSYFIDYPMDDFGVDIGAEDNPKKGHSNPIKKPYKKIKGIKKGLLSKHCIVVYSKDVAEREERNKEINRILQASLPALYKAGLSLATINFAKNRVPSHLKGKKLTHKSAAKLLAGAIYATANSTTMEGSSLWKHKGEGITQEKVEEIFGVTRKTIHKWARTFS